MEPVETRVPVRRWPWWALRVGVTAQAALTVLQPILAGRFLAGDFNALTLHRFNGIGVGVAAVAQIPLAILAWRGGGAPRALVVVAVLLAGGVAEQIHAGFARTLGIHVPLGVAVVGLTIWLLAWVWRHGPGTAR